LIELKVFIASVLFGLCVVTTVLTFTGSVSDNSYKPFTYMKGPTGSAGTNNTCVAPCIVKFPKDMEEDEFKVDYTNHQLRVWRKKH